MLPNAVTCALCHLRLMYQQCRNVVQCLIHHSTAIVTPKARSGEAALGEMP